MKISIKTIKGELFTVEIEPTSTILELKKRIEEVKGMEVSTQKLILKGTNTVDDKTLNDYQVKEGDFFVVMQTKKIQSQVQPQPVSNPVQNQPAPNPQPQPQPQSQPQNVSQPGQLGFEQASVSNVVMGEKFEKTVDEICNMGFPREDVKKALRAAFNNPDRAIDYLINGIPNVPDVGGAGAHPGPLAGSGAGQGQSLPVGAGAGVGGGHAGFGGQPGAGGELLTALLNNPQFLNLRNMIRANPQLLQPLLLQLQSSQPELYNAITQNQEAFSRWLVEGADAPGGGAQGGQHVIHVTPEEKEAIDRLVALGFERQVVIQAYLVCDKDESLAANYLFDNAAQAEVDEYEYLQAQNRPQGQPQGGQVNPNPNPNPPVQSNVQPNQPNPNPQSQNPPNQPAQPGQPKNDQEPAPGQPQGDQNQKKDKDDDDDTIFS